MKTFKKILAAIALVILGTVILTLIGGILFDEWLWGVAIVGCIAVIVLILMAIGSIAMLIEYLNK